MTTYFAYVDNYFVEVQYSQETNAIEISVGSCGVTDYFITLNNKTRDTPNFKRFNNDIRARIGAGIHLCSETPGYSLNHLYLAQDNHPNPWWKQRGNVPTC